MQTKEYKRLNITRFRASVLITGTLNPVSLLDTTNHNDFNLYNVTKSVITSFVIFPELIITASGKDGKSSVFKSKFQSMRTAESAYMSFRTEGEEFLEAADYLNFAYDNEILSKSEIDDLVHNIEEATNVRYRRVQAVLISDDKKIELTRIYSDRDGPIFLVEDINIGKIHGRWWRSVDISDQIDAALSNW